MLSHLHHPFPIITIDILMIIDIEMKNHQCQYLNNESTIIMMDNIIMIQSNSQSLVGENDMMIIPIMMMLLSDPIKDVKFPMMVMIMVIIIIIDIVVVDRIIVAITMPITTIDHHQQHDRMTIILIDHQVVHQYHRYQQQRQQHRNL